MRFFKMILVFGIFAVLLVACNTVVFERSECEASTVSSGAVSSVLVNCENVSTPQILTKDDIQEIQANFDIHRQLWESNDLNHYCFGERYFYIGFGSYINDEFTNCVSNGQNHLDNRNIDYHFSNIQAKVDSYTNLGLIGISVVYNIEYGHPINYSFTTVTSSTDGGGTEGYYITNFKIKN